MSDVSAKMCAQLKRGNVEGMFYLLASGLILCQAPLLPVQDCLAHV